MVIIYTPKDLNRNGSEIPFDEIDLIHTRHTYRQSETASTILYSDGERVKVLKSRYPISSDLPQIAIPLAKHDCHTFTAV